MRKLDAWWILSAVVIGLLPGMAWAQPAIKPGGVVSAAAFGGFASIAPASWIEIYGSNLATNTRSWSGSDFNGVNAPTSLDGTSVTVGGQAAFIDFISPGQVNAQVPSNLLTGQQQVVVKVGAVSSTPYSINVNAVQPGLLAPDVFKAGGQQYAAALFSDGVTFALPPGAIPGVPSKRAQPGDTITFYGLGFGSVVPNIPAGQVVQQVNALSAPVQVKFGQTQAQVTYAGLAPNAVGLYQFNVVVPTVPGSDSIPLTFTVGGVSSTQSLAIPVQSGSSGAQLQSVNVNPSSVTGGQAVVGTVYLSGPAPAGGVVVALSSSSSAVTVPSTVTVPAGSAFSQFNMSTAAVTSNQNVTLSATYGGGSVQTVLTVNAPAGGLPKFAAIQISSVAVTSSNQPGVTIAGASAAFPSPSVSGGGMSGIVINSSFTYLVFAAKWTTTSVNGFVVALSNIDTDFSLMSAQGHSSGITDGSVTMTLTPQGDGSHGTVNGSFSVTSAITTISGNFTALYTLI